MEPVWLLKLLFQRQNGRRLPSWWCSKKCTFPWLARKRFADEWVWKMSRRGNGHLQRIINGVSYDILKKLQVVDTYQELLEARIGFREQSLRDCETATGCWRSPRLLLMRDLKNALDDELMLVFFFHSWTSLAVSKDREQGRQDSHDVTCLIILLRQNPSRTIESYRRL